MHIRPRTLPRALTLALVAGMMMMTTGCPHTKRRTLVPTIPTTGDATARARFQDAKTRFERDGGQEAAEFEAIVDAYPDDPIAPYALLYAGISALSSRDHDRAVDNLTRLDEEPDVDRGLRTRGRLFLGVALVYQGRYQPGLAHLRAGEAAIESPGERGEWLAAMAEALGRSREPAQALDYYDRWYEDASESERAYIVGRLQDVVARLDAAAARQAYERLSRRDAPSAAVLGLRVAADWSAQGSPDNALRVRRQTEAARQAVGLLDTPPPAAEAGDPGLLGALLPLTGRHGRAGELAMRGLALASGTFQEARGSDMRPFQVSACDTASTAAGSAAAVADCARDGAIAVVGPIDGQSVDAAAGKAHAHGVPLISLNPRSSRRDRERSRYVFHMLQSAEDRAEALARHAHARGVRAFAILRPDDGYGRAVGRAFRDEVKRLGGTIVSEASYSPKATSFGAPIKKLGSGWDAVFIPEQAARLALIAPALAAADLEVAPLGAPAERRRRPGRRVALLSTAEFVAPSYLRSAGRYSVGAVLAPGFFPDREDAQIRDFVSRYELAFGGLPTALDAYAYDAALVVRHAVSAGAETRAELVDSLAASQVTGLTGVISFGEDQRRADDGLLYTVVRVGEAHAIRAMRD